MVEVDVVGLDHKLPQFLEYVVLGRLLESLLSPFYGQVLGQLVTLALSLFIIYRVKVGIIDAGSRICLFCLVV